MKRYALFAGDHYYPSGGIGDLVGSFETIEEAKAKGRDALSEFNINDYNDWFHVVDLQSEDGTVVFDTKDDEE